MDLKSINDEYLQFKKDLETIKKEKDAISKQVSKIKNELIILEATKSNAVLDGDKAKEQQYEAAIKTKKEELDKISKQLVEKKVKLVEVQVKIEERIEQVRNNPELKEHLDEALVKRYSRSIKKVNEEKNEAINKRDNFVRLNDLAEKHPSVKKNLIGMTNAQKEIKALKEELSKLANPPINGLVTYTDPARANDIMTKFLPIANAKYNKNKDLLTKYAKTQRLDIKDQELLELTQALTLNKGHIDIKGTVEKQVRNINKEVKGYNKQLLNLSNAINSIDKTSIQKTQAQAQAQANKNITPVKTGFFSRLVAKFKNWRNKNEQKSLPQAVPTNQPAPVVNNTAKKKSEFAASMKYDIVKEEFDKMEKDNIKAGKQQRKQAQPDLDRD